MRWPIGLAVAFLVVIAMNAAFLWIAVGHAPDVEDSYVHAAHR